MNPLRTTGSDLDRSAGGLRLSLLRKKKLYTMMSSKTAMRTYTPRPKLKSKPKIVLRPTL